MAVSFRRLVEAGVHFGHQTFRWCPKMAPYIWGSKNKVHLIDVSKTALQIDKASQFLHTIASEGKQILWVGTKKSSQKLIYDIATKLNMPYINHRWVGGTLSNNTQVKKSLTKWMHLEDVLEKSEKFPFYTKKELSIFNKMVQRLERSIGGLRKLDLSKLGAVVIVDVDREYSALLEATGMNIPVVGLVDTNSDPSMVDYVIPANDDSAQSIGLIFEYLSDSIEKGIAIATKKDTSAKTVAPNKKNDEEKVKATKKTVAPKKSSSAIKEKSVSKKSNPKKSSSDSKSSNTATKKVTTNKK